MCMTTATHARQHSGKVQLHKFNQQLPHLLWIPATGWLAIVLLNACSDSWKSKAATAEPKQQYACW